MSSDQQNNSKGRNPGVTNETQGDPATSMSTVLETGASMVQDLKPVKNICAFLNAFHVYADEPSRTVEAQHYCGHLNEDVRQCLLYDSPEKNARLIGVEYMVSPELYETLDPAERRLWHSHVFEVKSGMLIMPKPALIPEAVWELAENKEMEKVIQLYGKTYSLWQVDRGDKLPLGEPRLMASITHEDQVPDFHGMVTERDIRFGSDYMRKREVRKLIPDPEVHPDADKCKESKKHGKHGKHDSQKTEMQPQRVFN
ncbi:hypothetical protein B0H34DRAFT_800683 [Crassisporium funariophilum]|nr:hypothetical protein B0H34DRAFT_800683 [Crassisporium funariophilum]